MKISNISDNCSCMDCLRRSPVFNFLTEQELKKFNDSRYNTHYNAGEIIFKQGTALTHLLSFTSGLAKVYIEGFNRRNIILRLIKSGEFICGPGMYTDFKHHYTISAIEDSTACFIDVNVHQEIMAENHVFAMHSYKNANLNTLNNFTKFISLTQKQMAGRIADSLLYLHEEVYLSNPFSLTLSRQELADMTSMSKESAIRILKQFKDDKIIRIDRDKFEIIEIKKLTEISRFG